MDRPLKKEATKKVEKAKVEKPQPHRFNP